jgi:hypothetical protein
MLKRSIYRISRVILFLSACLFSRLPSGHLLAAPPNEPDIVLTSKQWVLRIIPSSLAVHATLTNKESILLSAPQQGLGRITALHRSDVEASWEFPGRGISVSIQLKDNKLELQFQSRQTGSFTWPILQPQMAVKGYILPWGEGIYVSTQESPWQDYLIEMGPLNTMETLSMPFWGLDCGSHTLTYLFTNPFHNELSFFRQECSLGSQLRHDFLRNQVRKEFGFQILLGGVSPVEPANLYRQWLITNGEFVPLAEKIKRVPDVEKLLGASHIYLWADTVLAPDDIIDWQGFARKFRTQGESSKSSPIRRMWELLNPGQQNTLREIDSSHFVSEHLKKEVVHALDELLRRKDFYLQSYWEEIPLPVGIHVYLSRGIDHLNQAEIVQLNGLLLETAFSGLTVPSRQWGDGISPKMIQQFKDSGFDRLWLGLDELEVVRRLPGAVALAKKLGYLIAPYDSYHSIHDPNQQDTWATAQFDRELYQTGAVIGADGKKKVGFQGKGYILSSIAAKPYVKRRVAEIQQALWFNSWFMDCDATGELFDNFSDRYPATIDEDMNARLERMAWITDTYQTVMGSETGNSFAAPVIHFGHGMMTPVFGFFDPLLKDPKSLYFVGKYYPADGPHCFMKTTLLPEKYRLLFFDPRSRLPLFQTALHDSVVTTHHWTNPSLKFSNVSAVNELLELLYTVPPLYHMNLKEFSRHRKNMALHNTFFSPLHRETGLLPMSEFRWLTEDRMVQKTVFGNKVEMVVNFGNTTFKYQGTVIHPLSILARRLESGEVKIYSSPLITPARRWTPTDQLK